MIFIAKVYDYIYSTYLFFCIHNIVKVNDNVFIDNILLLYERDASVFQ